MPMYQAIAIFFLSLALAGVAATRMDRVRRPLSGPADWLLLLALGTGSSALSGLVVATRHSGTGFTTSHGWPKPFFFRYLSETGDRSDGLNLVYFVGNALVFTSGALIIWTVWRIIRR